MPLEPGTRIGVYEIAGKIGAGGMGEVYRATDTKLGRDVAIKIVPSAVAGDRDRLLRFEREAKLLAALNHANIASIYGIDEHDGAQFIAMELVEGRTLEDRLKAGTLPVDDALRIALQIAEALEAAHAKGVVHRDLKPANVMLTGDGTVKVLDFGLAKALSNDPADASPAHSPTLSLAMTQAGLVLGTAGYMSPEQASGQGTDQRADVWAFGVVLYEMLTGLPLFTGESVPHILADVLKSEPDWTRLPADLHPRIRLMLARCLTKKPRDRYHSIADARVDIEAALGDPQGIAAEAPGATRAAASPATTHSFGAGVLLAALGAAAAGIAAWALWPAAPSAPVTRFSIDLLGPLGFLDSVALSPDGRRIVYAADGRLWVRRLDQDETIAMPGTEQGTNPFFSPDGESLAFFTQNELKAVGFGGEIARVLAGVGPPSGIVGTWDREGRIVFGRVGGFDLFRVPAVGGNPATFAELGGYRDLDYPDALPGGEWVLFTGQKTDNWSDSDLVVQHVATGERRVVFEGGHFARYLPTGHLAFARRGTLYAVAFDVDRLETTGAAVPIVQGMSVSEVSGHAHYAVAANGTLIYAPGAPLDTDQRSAIVEVSAEGSTSRLSTELRNYGSPRLSPDGTRAAMAVDEPDGRSHIWTMDLRTGRATQLTFEGVANRYPIWSLDGNDVLYTSVADGQASIFRKAADGTGRPERVLDGTARLVATDVLPDNVLLFQDVSERGDRDLLLFDLDAGGPPEPFLATPAEEASARASPNGAWIAYTSFESGDNRVYVRPYPPTTGGQRAVSEELSAGPVWSRSGDELYYIGVLGELKAVPIATTGTTIEIGRAERRYDFMTRMQSKSFTETAPYDAWTDGTGLIASQLASNAADGENPAATARPTLNVVLNWFEELNRLVPAP